MRVSEALDTGSIPVGRAIDFTLAKGCAFIAVAALLKAVGVCESGGAGQLRVAAGLVSVDGVLESRKRAKIRPGQRVVCGDVHIVVRAA